MEKSLLRAELRGVLSPTSLVSGLRMRLFAHPSGGVAFRTVKSGKLSESLANRKGAFMQALIRTLVATYLLAVPAFLLAQDTAPPATDQPAPSTYTPKFRGDPARSDSEARALGYMRVVMRAEVVFNKKNNHYATSLTQLVHTGTFTQRMVNTERDDYTVGFRPTKDGFVLTMTPKNLDAQHRSFYAEEDGKIHADESKAADADSQVVESHHW